MAKSLARQTESRLYKNTTSDSVDAASAMRDKGTTDDGNAPLVFVLDEGGAVLLVKEVLEEVLGELVELPVLAEEDVPCRPLVSLTIVE